MAYTELCYVYVSKISFNLFKGAVEKCDEFGRISAYIS